MLLHCNKEAFDVNARKITGYYRKTNGILLQILIGIGIGIRIRDLKCGDVAK